jgi:fructose-1,6-bisphosphatase I
MNEIIESIKQSTIEIKNIIIKGDTGKSEQQNSTGDTQLKLDIASDIVIENNFKKLSCVKQIVSEEQDHIVDINESGKYYIAYDPLDGSSLVDVNLSVGSIYAIYENGFSGQNIIGAIYVVFGPRVEMVVCDGKTVKLYRMDEHKNFNFTQELTMGKKGNINSPGSTQQCWYDNHRKLVNNMFDQGYELSYSGGMVPDLHHVLLRGGGLFSYPGASDKPKGKLRQLFEVFPFAFIFETAGGASSDGFKSALQVSNTHIHDTSPCFLGSIDEINLVHNYYKES